MFTHTLCPWTKMHNVSEHLWRDLVIQRVPIQFVKKQVCFQKRRWEPGPARTSAWAVHIEGSSILSGTANRWDLDVYSSRTRPWGPRVSMVFFVKTDGTLIYWYIYQDFFFFWHRWNPMPSPKLCSLTLYALEQKDTMWVNICVEILCQSNL